MSKGTKRVVLIVMDGVGIGSLPDAGEYGEINANTLGHVCQVLGGLKLPNFQKLGLGNIINLEGIPAIDSPKAFFGSISPHTKENDSAPLHWEMMGIYNSRRMTLFPHGLPENVLKQFYNKTGMKCVGNIMIERGNDLDQLRTISYLKQKPAVYSTTDSVIQIIAHDKQISTEHLYYLAKTLREILNNGYYVGRVIVKMFTGNPGAFIRIPEKRKDFTIVPPTNDFLLPRLQEKNINVIGIGKIFDFFSGIGLTKSFKTKNNLQGIEQIITLLNKQKEGFIFTNLLDFDTLGGHSNNPVIFAKCLREMDAKLPAIINLLKPSDLLIITADHGNDPTLEIKTHTREYTPLLFVYPDKAGKSGPLGVRPTFADIGATIAQWFGIKIDFGNSFLEQ